MTQTVENPVVTPPPTAAALLQRVILPRAGDPMAVRALYVDEHTGIRLAPVPAPPGFPPREDTPLAPNPLCTSFQPSRLQRVACWRSTRRPVSRSSRPCRSSGRHSGAGTRGAQDHQPYSCTVVTSGSAAWWSGCHSPGCGR